MGIREVEVYVDEKSSKKYKLNKEDSLKIAKGFGIAIGGAVLTILTDLIPIIEWGEYTPVVMALSSTLINLTWKWLKGKK